MEGKIKIGKVTRLHGFKGELSLKLDPEYADLFDNLEHVYLEIDKKPVPFFIDAARFTPQGYVLVFFDGVDNQAAAERLRGYPIYMDEDVIPENHHSEDALVNLVGYAVEDQKEGNLGKVSSVVEHPGNSFLVLDREDGEILVPFVEPIIISVNHDKETIMTRVPDGLISLNLD